LIFGQAFKGMLELAEAGRAEHVGWSSGSGAGEKSGFNQRARARGGGLSADAEPGCHKSCQVARMRRNGSQQSGVNLVGTI
jgi:hypothetical protein